MNPIDRFLERQGVMILDGGLATSLERAGHRLNDDLWSARLLLEDPHAIARAHLAFLAAGADCIATASYQASLPGFLRKGLSEAEGVDLLRLSVRLAVETRDEFWKALGDHSARIRPLVAASIGPYGAFLADGSEYSGRYGVDDAALATFHRTRWHVLAESDADLIACETIPSQREADVLLQLVRETPGRVAWISFSCKDEQHLHDESRLADAARACEGVAGVVAVGINCTAPELIPALIGEARSGTAKPILVYPNAGGHYEADDKIWAWSTARVDWPRASHAWARAGASGVGGCCGVAPNDIAAIRRALVRSPT